MENETLTYEEKERDYKTKDRIQMKTYVLFGQKIEIDRDIMTYSNFYKSYVRDAAEEMMKFENFLDQECEDIRDVVAYGSQICKNVVDYLVERAISTLVANDIYDMDEGTYLQKYGRKYLNWDFLKKWEKICKDIDQNYNASMESARRKADYNSISSTRYSGGGFGFQGAVKGMITASVLNGLSDRSARKSAERTLRRDVRDLEEVYNRQISSVYNEDTKREILSDFFDMFMGGLYAILDELEARDLFEYPAFDIPKAEVIAKNTAKYAHDKKKYIDNMVQCIILDPLEEEYYISLYLRDDISDEDAETLDEMVHTLTRATVFDVKTQVIKCEREQKIIFEKIEKCLKRDVVGKAEILYEILEKKRRERELYTNEIKKQVDSFFSDELLVIKNTVDKEVSGKGLDEKKAIEAYCNQAGLKKEDGGKLSVMYFYANILEKYPFFRVFSKSELVLDNFEEFNDFLNRVDEVQTESELSLEQVMPEALSVRIKEAMEDMWHQMGNIEELEHFIRLNNRYAQTFSKPVIAKKKYSNRRKELEKQKEINDYFENSYGQYIANPKEVPLEILIALAKDRNTKIPKNDRNDLSDGYMKTLLEGYSGDYKQRNELGLVKLVKELKKVHDPLSAEIRRKVEKCYNDRIVSFAPVSLVTYDEDKYGLKIYVDLKDIKTVRNAKQIREQLLDVFKDLGRGYHYIGREDQVTFADGAEIAKKNYAQDIGSVYDILIIEDINPRTASARCEKGFAISTKGIAYKNTYGKGYFKLVNLEGLVIEKASKEEYVLYAILGEKSGQKKALASRENEDELRKVVNLIRSILICMYNLPDGNYDESKIEYQAKRAENILQASSNMDIMELENALKELQEYPDFIAKQAVGKIQTLWNEKNIVIKEEYESFIKGYQKKDEQELQHMLSQMEKYPKELTKKDEISIRELMKQKVTEKKNAEIAGLCSGFEQKNVKELELIIEKIKKEYKDISAAKEWCDRLENKCKEIRRQEYDAFIAGYRDKNEEELKEILSKIKDYPIEYTRDDEENIRQLLEKKILEQKKAELMEVCNGWEQKSKEELVVLISMIREQYANVPEMSGMCKKMQDKCDQYDTESLEKLTESLETMNMKELRDLQEKMSREFPGRLSTAFIKRIESMIETKENEEYCELLQSVLSEKDALNPEVVVGKFQTAGYDMNGDETWEKMLSTYEEIVIQHMNNEDRQFLANCLRAFAPNYGCFGMKDMLVIPAKFRIKECMDAFKEHKDIPMMALGLVPVVLISKKNVYVYLRNAKDCRVYSNTEFFEPYAKTGFLKNDVHAKNVLSDKGYLFSCNSKADAIAQADSLAKLCAFVRRFGKETEVKNNEEFRYNEVQREIKADPVVATQTIPTKQFSDDITTRIYAESMRLNVNKPSELFSICNCTKKYDKKINNAMSKYVKLADDKPLLLYDYTVFESGKEGFVISDKYFYYNYPGNTGKMEFAQIDRFVAEQQKVYMVETSGKKWAVVPVNLDETVARGRAEFLNYVLGELTVKANNVAPKFCGKCGARIAQEGAFCGQCGNKLF